MPPSVSQSMSPTENQRNTEAKYMEHISNSKNAEGKNDMKHQKIIAKGVEFMLMNDKNV